MTERWWIYVLAVGASFVVGAVVARRQLLRLVDAEPEWEVGEVDAPPAVRAVTDHLAAVGFAGVGVFRLRANRLLTFSALLRSPDSTLLAQVIWTVPDRRPRGDPAPPRKGTQVAICSGLGGDRRFFTATTWWYDAGDAVLVQTLPRARPAELLAAHRAGLDHLAARGLVAAPFGEGVRATVVADHARFGAVVNAHPWRLTGRLLLASLLRRQPFRGPIAGRPDAAARIALWQGVLR